MTDLFTPDRSVAPGDDVRTIGGGEDILDFDGGDAYGEFANSNCKCQIHHSANLLVTVNDDFFMDFNDSVAADSYARSPDGSIYDRDLLNAPAAPSPIQEENEVDPRPTHESGSEERPPQETDSCDTDSEAIPDDRDCAFRFDVPPPPPPAHELFVSSAYSKFWQPILLLVTYLNLRYHLPHRACNLALSAAKIVLSRLGHFNESDKPITTLRPAFNILGLKEPFLILPLCPTCHRVYPDDSPINLKCYSCLIPLFRTKVSLRNDFDGSDAKSEDRISKACLKCPVFPLSAQLPAFVCRFEEELENSLQVEYQEGVLRDIRDGRIWREARDSDGSHFFSRDNTDVLRIGIILHFDGYFFSYFIYHMRSDMVLL